MAAYLLDTNVLLRLVDRASPDHAPAAQAVERLLSRRESCYLTPQVLVEFWAVATRPVAVNGLGWTSGQARTEVEALLDQFPLLEETPAVFENWLGLVTDQQVVGKQVHDARLAAVMHTHSISRLLTFNLEDFPPGYRVEAAHPAAVE